jgi:hypothetical protein
MRNLCDLFLHELAHLDVSVRALRDGLQEFSGKASCAHMRDVLDQIDAVARTHLFPLDQALAEHRIVPPESRSPALQGMLEEARECVECATHPSVSGAGLLAAVRRMTRYMECLCLASAESALLLGYDEIRRDLSGWAAAWRGLERQLQRASIESNAAAFLAP